MNDMAASVKSCHWWVHKRKRVLAVAVIICAVLLMFSNLEIFFPANFSEKYRIQKMEENVTWRKNILSRLHPTYKCTCSNAVFAKVEEKADFINRRSTLLEKYKKRVDPFPEQLVMVKGRDPLSYPVRGLTVVPQGTVQIPGLEVVEEVTRQEYKVQLQALNYGTLDITAEVAEVHSEGLDSKSVAIRSNSLARLNRQLLYVVYSNTVYDIDATESVTFRYLNYEGSIPIRIRAPRLPFLYDPGTNNIEAKVTIVTKTFLRYDAIRALLDSIRTFYPNIRVIVADDSRPVEDLQGENVDHFVMPYAAGWFAGRNLGVSQVATEYFLWVDDDFVFIPETKLENFVDVLENTNLDLVSGVVGTRGVKFTKMTIVPGGEDGDCLVIHDLHHWGQVPGFSQCYYATRVTNFFVARTDSIRAVGFDPTYTRQGHTQFFMAGIGKLRIAACDDVRIDHRSMRTKEYTHFRYPSHDYDKINKEHQYFKHNIKCWQSNKF